jgi:hypothetical protein
MIPAGAGRGHLFCLLHLLYFIKQPLLISDRFTSIVKKPRKYEKISAADGGTGFYAGFFPGQFDECYG